MLLGLYGGAQLAGSAFVCLVLPVIQLMSAYMFLFCNCGVCPMHTDWWILRDCRAGRTGALLLCPAIEAAVCCFVASAFTLRHGG